MLNIARREPFQAALLKYSQTTIPRITLWSLSSPLPAAYKSCQRYYRPPPNQSSTMVIRASLPLIALVLPIQQPIPSSLRYVGQSIDEYVGNCQVAASRTVVQLQCLPATMFASNNDIQICLDTALPNCGDEYRVIKCHFTDVKIELATWPNIKAFSYLQ